MLLHEPTGREDEETWTRRLTVEQFFAGYNEAAAVYDKI